MSLLKKNAEQNKPDCCCEANGTANNTAKAQKLSADAGIKVLGLGCAKCSALEAAVKEALAELKTEMPVEHVTDFAQIAAYGVMSLPALVVDGRVVSSGRVLNKREAADIIKKARG